VLDDVIAFLDDVAVRPEHEAGGYGRLILPPRTGKTVIAAAALGHARCPATFIAPTKALVEQSARELGARLPGTPVGTYFSDRKDVVARGVNVTTYAMLQRDFSAGRVPRAIRESALVFADEAHHVLTAERARMLREVFPPSAARIALTATPDYDDERLLCRVFPELVHEVTLEEALELDLLAPLRVWVVEVDADGASVQVVAGDFDEEMLGRVMSSAPFARAVEVFRYGAVHAGTKALIACASRQQASDLHRYLTEHRPPRTPPPALILGETPSDERERLLLAFEEGAIDTLVQVGVLIEGWSSPRCKLLLDLAPSLSRVRATQKYFRVMTKHEALEARIVVLVPTSLPRLPILPTDLFGASARDYECGELIASAQSSGGRARLAHLAHHPVAGVHVKGRVVFSASLARPGLDKESDTELRAVLVTAEPPFDAARPPGLFRFRSLLFRHPLFTGRGDTLLRWMGVPCTRSAYHAFLARLGVDGPAYLALLDEPIATCDQSCRDDARWLLRALRHPVEPGQRRDEALVDGYRALSGRPLEAPPDPCAVALIEERREQIAYALGLLKVRDRRRLAEVFGLLEQRPRTRSAVAREVYRSDARVSMQVRSALRALQPLLLRSPDGLVEIARRTVRVNERPPPPYRRGAPAPRLWEERHAAVPPTGWWELAVPRDARALFTMASRILAVEIGVDLGGVEPDVTTWQDGGAQHVEVCWHARGASFRLLRHGHAWSPTPGVERERHGLWAEIYGLRNEVELYAMGDEPHHVTLVTSIGSERTGLHAAWREAMGALGPRAARRHRRPYGDDLYLPAAAFLQPPDQRSARPESPSWGPVASRGETAPQAPSSSSATLREGTRRAAVRP